jgi:hypothetical protein
VHGLSVVQNSYLPLAIFTALAVLRSHQIRLIFAPRSEATKSSFSTDAKPSVESSVLELYRGAKEEKPPLGGLKGRFGGVVNIFVIF